MGRDQETEQKMTADIVETIGINCAYHFYCSLIAC